MQTPDFFLVDEIRYVGPYLSQRLTAQGIDDVGDLRRHFRNRTPRSIERRLARICTNSRGNLCVDGPRGTRYHTSDVNIYGFNALLRVLRETNAGARRVQYRVRGPPVDAGQRGCGCRGMHSCNATAACRWREGACIPNIDRPVVAQQGFEGAGARRDVAGQYRRTMAQSPAGHRYVRRWRVPGAAAAAAAAAAAPPPPPAQPVARRTRASTAPISSRTRG